MDYPVRHNVCIIDSPWASAKLRYGFAADQRSTVRKATHRTVALVPPSDIPHAVVIKRICVPTDFSEPAERALHCGAALAEKFGAELYLLHVLQDVRALVHIRISLRMATLHAPISIASNKRRQAESSQRKILRSVLENLGADGPRRIPEAAAATWWERLPIKKLLRYGNPVEEICHFARKKPNDMLVMGTHGRTGLKHMLLGASWSVSSASALAPC